MNPRILAVRRGEPRAFLPGESFAGWYETVFTSSSPTPLARIATQAEE
jgi:hypothetical protein